MIDSHAVFWPAGNPFPTLWVSLKARTKKSGYWKKKHIKVCVNFMFGRMWQCKQSNVEGRINLLLLQMDVSVQPQFQP